MATLSFHAACLDVVVPEDVVDTLVVVIAKELFDRIVAMPSINLIETSSGSGLMSVLLPDICFFIASSTCALLKRVPLS